MEAGEPGWRTSMLDANPDLLGHVYAGPYLHFEPDLATIAVDSTGVAGYLLATSVTRAFWAWQEKNWWPPLRDQYPLDGKDGWNAGIVELIHAPPVAPDHIARDFPAHFHIDLLPRAQGVGLGRDLIEDLESKLRKKSVSGVHLDVGSENHDAIGFYQHLGFTVLAEGLDSLFMGKRL
jgi:ribosomal protein S18 acetylase RimI-like enzyme|tara:strand:- start:2 stop:535 length:534 start_codon:yes stop_codon:yes gene_type:complete